MLPDTYKTLSNLTPEERLLLGSLKPCPTDDDLAAFSECLAQADQAKLLASATKHQVLGLLHRLLTSMRLPSGDPLADMCAKLYRTVQNKNQAAATHVKRVIGALSDANCRAVVVKGFALAQLVYRDLGLRQIGDLDLLVSRQAVMDADEILRTLGYGMGDRYNEGRLELYSEAQTAARLRSAKVHMHPHLPLTMEHRSKVAIELHHQDRYFGVDLCKLRGAAVRVELYGVAALALDTVDSLIYSCGHFFGNAGRGQRFAMNEVQLKQVADILWLAREIDADRLWPGFVPRVKECGAEDCVFFSLHHLVRLFPEYVPPDVVAACRPTNPRLYFDNASSISAESCAHLMVDEWHYPIGTSTFLARMLYPDLLSEILGRLRRQGLASGVAIAKRRRDDARALGHRTTKQKSSTGHSLEIRESQVPHWQFFQTHVEQGRPPRDDNDLFVTCDLMWDTDYLYVEADVHDDTVVPYTGRSVCDQLLISIYPFRSTQGKPWYRWEIAFDTCRKAHFEARRFSYDDGDLISTKIPPAGAGSVALSFQDWGYRVDARIPWRSLEVLPRYRATLGFDLHVLDCDAEGVDSPTAIETGTYRRMAWSGGEGEPVRFQGTIVLRGYS